MQRLFSPINLMLFISSISIAQNISSTIKEVTVYLDKGAKINRVAATPMVAGLSEIILDGLESDLRVSCIQVAFSNPAISKNRQIFL